MISVVGYTGKVGSAVSERLLAQGRQVRGVCRSPRRASHETVAANLSDREGMTRALEDSAAVLAICPLDPRSNDLAGEVAAQVESLGAALERAGPGHVVAISDYGAHGGRGIPGLFRDFEERLRATDIPTTVVRSAEHLENWPAVMSRTSTVPWFYPPQSGPRPFVSALDLARVAAELLLEDAPPEFTVLHLEGPRRYSFDDLRTALPATHLLQFVPPELRGRALARAGLTASWIEFLEATYQAHGEGLVEVASGPPPRRGALALEEILRT